MFRADQLCLEYLGFEIGYLQNFFRCFRQRNVGEVFYFVCSGALGNLFDFSTEFFEWYSQFFQNAYSNTFTFANHSEQKMLCANVIMAETQCFFPAK
jgi:hypothetical protein